MFYEDEYIDYSINHEGETVMVVKDNLKQKIGDDESRMSKIGKEQSSNENRDNDKFYLLNYVNQIAKYTSLLDEVVKLSEEIKNNKVKKIAR